MVFMGVASVSLDGIDSVSPVSRLSMLVRYSEDYDSFLVNAVD
jgi:hypothetical protein